MESLSHEESPRNIDAELADSDTELTLASLDSLPIWLAWQEEPAENASAKPKKVPYQARSQAKASATTPGHRGTRAQAEQRAARLSRPLERGGVGVVLTNIGDDLHLTGIDLDSCRDPSDGSIAEWAQEIVVRLASYTEVSPSETGLKVFLLMQAAERDAILAEMRGPGGDDSEGIKWARGGGEHPPAIELYLGRRYFTVTGQPLEGTADALRRVQAEDLQWLLRVAGPAFRGNGHDHSGYGEARDESRSGAAFRLALKLRRAGKIKSYEEMGAAMRAEVERTLFTHRPENGDRLELREVGDNGTVDLVLISPATPDLAGTTPPMSTGAFKLPAQAPWAKGPASPTVVTDHARLRQQNQDARKFWNI